MFNKDILLSVSKPSRYIGQEINAVVKDPAGVRTRVALAFPDTYEIGMSHLGIKILYHILNSMEGVAAERVFVPWVDLEDVLIKKGLPLVSLETSCPIREFDILGITLPYELCYTNILTILKLSSIPLYSADRDEHDPLVIGGGTAVFNPEPMADYFDAFFLGDGEEGIKDIVNIFESWKRSQKSRKSLLSELSKIEGVYIPSFYSVTYKDDQTIQSMQLRDNAGDGVKKEVRKRVVEDLDSAPFPAATPLPYMQIIHDRLTVEIARGCTHGCRFCQAGMTYRPVRERSPEKILEIIEDSLKNTGYEEVSLASLSTGDFACLGNMLSSLTERYGREHLALSLPSLRIGTLTPHIIDQITSSKNSSFTIAPEAGTENLRRIINKEMTEESFDATIEDVFRRGVKSVKMYFMIGLPTEDTGDLEGIIALARRAKDIGRRFKKGERNITVSVSTFVPKAHTPFQWNRQAPRNEIKEKIDYLKNGLRKIGISFKWHRVEMSYLEAAFSRGDRRFGKVVEEAWKSGCRFDSWTERLDFNKWEEAFGKCSIDPDFFVTREISEEETLPWEHLHAGVTREFLLKERKRAFEGRLIPDCRYGNCPNCGVCDMDAVRGKKEEGIRPIARKPLPTPFPLPTTCYTLSPPPSPPLPFKVRLRYSKTGDMRMLSQLEIMTTYARALKRAQIPVSYSEGFHPHPRISFGPALPVGMESTSEYMDIELIRTLDLNQFMLDLNSCLPHGLEVLSIRKIPPGTPSLNEFILFYAYEIRLEKADIETYPDKLLLPDTGELWSSRIVEKNGKRTLREINTRPFISDIHWTGDNTIFLLLKSQKKECCRPSDVISALFKVAHDDPGIRIRRTDMYGKVGGVLTLPEEVDEHKMQLLSIQ